MPHKYDYWKFEAEIEFFGREVNAEGVAQLLPEEFGRFRSVSLEPAEGMTSAIIVSGDFDTTLEPVTERDAGQDIEVELIDELAAEFGSNRPGEGGYDVNTISIDPYESSPVGKTSEGNMKRKRAERFNQFDPAGSVWSRAEGCITRPEDPFEQKIEEIRDAMEENEVDRMDIQREVDNMGFDLDDIQDALTAALVPEGRRQKVMRKVEAEMSLDAALGILKDEFEGASYLGEGVGKFGQGASQTQQPFTPPGPLTDFVYPTYGPGTAPYGVAESLESAGRWIGQQVQDLVGTGAEKVKPGADLIRGPSGNTNERKLLEQAPGGYGDDDFESDFEVGELNSDGTQPNDWTCAPAAISYALEQAGVEPPEFDDLVERTGAGPENGVQPETIAEVLSDHADTFEVGSINELIDAVQEGNPVIVAVTDVDEADTYESEEDEDWTEDVEEDDEATEKEARKRSFLREILGETEESKPGVRVEPMGAGVPQSGVGAGVGASAGVDASGFAGPGRFSADRPVKSDILAPYSPYDLAQSGAEKTSFLRQVLGETSEEGDEGENIDDAGQKDETSLEEKLEGGTGHFVVITDFDEDAGTFQGFDPLEGDFEIEHDDLAARWVMNTDDGPEKTWGIAVQTDAGSVEDDEDEGGSEDESEETEEDETETGEEDEKKEGRRKHAAVDLVVVEVQGNDPNQIFGDLMRLAQRIGVRTKRPTAVHNGVEFEFPSLRQAETFAQHAMDQGYTEIQIEALQGNKWFLLKDFDEPLQRLTKPMGDIMEGKEGRRRLRAVQEVTFTPPEPSFVQKALDYIPGYDLPPSPVGVGAGAKGDVISGGSAGANPSMSGGLPKGHYAYEMIYGNPEGRTKLQRRKHAQTPPGVQPPPTPPTTVPMTGIQPAPGGRGDILDRALDVASDVKHNVVGYPGESFSAGYESPDVSFVAVPPNSVARMSDNAVATVPELVGYGLGQGAGAIRDVGKGVVDTFRGGRGKRAQTPAGVQPPPIPATTVPTMTPPTAGVQTPPGQTGAMGKRGVDLYVVYIGDGYLAAATTDDNGDDISYYPSEYQEQEWELYLLKNVPRKLAEQLEVQGTSDQYFSDGYDASNAAGNYDAELLDQGGPEDDGWNDDDDEEMD